MGASSLKLKPDGPKLYALRQITYFLGPITAREIAGHMSQCVRNSLSSHQVAHHLLALPDASSIPWTPNAQNSNPIGLYTIRKPFNHDVHNSTRKVDKYISNRLGVARNDRTPHQIQELPICGVSTIIENRDGFMPPNNRSDD